MQEKINKIKKLKLLFVEDEIDLINILSETLLKLEINFLIAKNGEEGIHILKDNPDIDLIITDINMPIMNGLDMIEQIKNTIDPKMTFIVMSAHTEDEYRKKADLLGVKHYLYKPFDFLKFIDLIVKMEL